MTETFKNLLEYIATIVPSLGGITGIVVTLILGIKELRKAIDTYVCNAEYKKTAKELQVAIDQNEVLKQDMEILKKHYNELLTAITHVEHK